MPERFGQFLLASFEALAREQPAIWARFCAQLAPRSVSILVDDDAVAVRFERSGVVRDGLPASPTIAVRTTRGAVLGLIDADVSLSDAILDDRLSLRGEVDDLLAFHDGLLTYVHGAVRAPSFPPLLAAYRRPDRAGEIGIHARNTQTP